MTSAKEKYNILLCVSCELIGEVTGEREFSTADHIRVNKRVEAGWEKITVCIA